MTFFYTKKLLRITRWNLSWLRIVSTEIVVSLLLKLTGQMYGRDLYIFINIYTYTYRQNRALWFIKHFSKLFILPKEGVSLHIWVWLLHTLYIYIYLGLKSHEPNQAQKRRHHTQERRLGVHLKKLDNHPNVVIFLNFYLGCQSDLTSCSRELPILVL